MATYNGATFLSEQLISINMQSRRPDELIVTDDCSTDDTWEVLDKFKGSAKIEDMRFERNPERLGAHRNFEKALGLATGDIIFLCDQDDVWDLNKISTVLEAFEPDKLALYHDERLMVDGTLVSGTFMERAEKLGWGRDMLTAGNCTVLRREALKWVLPFPGNVFFDDWINLVLERLGVRQILPVALQKWRRHKSNHSTPSIADDKPSRWREIKQFGLTDPRPGWTEQKNRLGLVLLRIAETFGAIDPERKSAAIKNLMADIKRLEQRIETVSRSKLVRWAKVGKLWSEGFYEPFSGWKSAFKDVVIP